MASSFEVPRKSSILLIDDSYDILTVQRVMLEHAGYDVVTAQSGEEALKVLGAIDEPDLILLDLQMEEMSGPEFLTALERERPAILNHVPVVLVTGMDEVPKTRAIGHIRKPSDTSRFLKAVHFFLEKSPYKH
jgi:two-component system response regulator GlrR